MAEVLSSEGITPQAPKLEAISQLAQQTNIRELQSFLGMCNVFRHFIPKMAEIVHHCPC